MKEQWKKVHGNNMPEKQEHQWKLAYSKNKVLDYMHRRYLGKKKNKQTHNAQSAWQVTKLQKNAWNQE